MTGAFIAMGGNTLEAVGTMSSLSCLKRGNNAPPSMSITKSMDEFLNAVQKMKDVVMIPNQLKDIKYLPDETGVTGNTSSTLDTPASSESSSVALISLPQEEVPVVNDPNLLMCYKMVDAVHNDLVNGPPIDSVPYGTSCGSLSGMNSQRIITSSPSVSRGPTPPPLSTNTLTLCKSISNDQTTFGQDDDADETRFAQLVRQQVASFLSAIHQLTDVANLLTEKYQEKIGTPDESDLGLGEAIPPSV